MKATLLMRKPFFTTAVQVTKENLDEVAAWCEGHVIDGSAGPFIRVPVDRAIAKWQTEAYLGTWVLESEPRPGHKSYKVYTQEMLDKHFYRVDDKIPDIDVDASKSSGSNKPSRTFTPSNMPSRNNAIRPRPFTGDSLTVFKDAS